MNTDRRKLPNLDDAHELEAIRRELQKAIQNDPIVHRAYQWAATKTDNFGHQTAIVVLILAGALQKLPKAIVAELKTSKP